MKAIIKILNFIGMHVFKTKIITTYTLAVLLLLAVVLLAKPALASLADSMQGFAWSGSPSVDGAYNGMGWISMNSLDCDTNGNGFVDSGACGGNDDATTPAVDYGVHVPIGPTGGDLSGYAWSEHYGWISFNGSDLTTPGAVCNPGLSQATSDGSTITGGARILAIRDEIIAGNAGGYDGCISLNEDTITLTLQPPSGGPVDPPRFAVSGSAWSSDLGWISFSGSGVPPDDYQVEVYDRRANLTQPAVRGLVFPTGYADATGVYNSVRVAFQTSNNGMTDVTVADGADYSIQLQVPVTAPINPPFNQTREDPLGEVLSGVANPDYTWDFANVPYGVMDLDVCVDINNPGGTTYNEVDEFDETDNCQDVSGVGVIVPPPTPNLSISVDRERIRSGETVTVSWDTVLSYPMDCLVGGPGVDTDLGSGTVLDPNTEGTIGSIDSTALDAKSVFTLQCTEPVTGTVFTETATVNVTGEIEET